MKKIKLSNKNKCKNSTLGLFALVDDEDYLFLSQWNWCMRKTKNLLYAVRKDYSSKKKVYMHRVLLEIKDSKTFVDHIDHNGLNNQRINLRKCDASKNGMNGRKSTKTKASMYKGVSLCNIKNKNSEEIYKYWQVRIVINKKPTHIGLFKNETEAAKAYNIAALKHYGEFANLNPV